MQKPYRPSWSEHNLTTCTQSTSCCTRLTVPRLPHNGLFSRGKPGYVQWTGSTANALPCNDNITNHCRFSYTITSYSSNGNGTLAEQQKLNVIRCQDDKALPLHTWKVIPPLMRSPSERLGESWTCKRTDETNTVGIDYPDSMQQGMCIREQTESPW